MEPYTDIITGSSYIQVGQAHLSNGIFLVFEIFFASMHALRTSAFNFWQL